MNIVTAQPDAGTRSDEAPFSAAEQASRLRAACNATYEIDAVVRVLCREVARRDHESLEIILPAMLKRVLALNDVPMSALGGDDSRPTAELHQVVGFVDERAASEAASEAPAAAPRADDFAEERSRLAQERAQSASTMDELLRAPWGEKHFALLATNLGHAEAILVIATRNLLEFSDSVDFSQVANVVSCARDSVDSAATLTAEVGHEMPFLEHLARALSLLSMIEPMIDAEFDLLGDEGLIANYFEVVCTLLRQTNSLAAEAAMRQRRTNDAAGAA